MYLNTAISEDLFKHRFWIWSYFSLECVLEILLCCSFPLPMIFPAELEEIKGIRINTNETQLIQVKSMYHDRLLFVILRISVGFIYSPKYYSKSSQGSHCLFIVKTISPVPVSKIQSLWHLPPSDTQGNLLTLNLH